MRLSGRSDDPIVQPLHDATRFGAARAIGKPFQVDEVLMAVQAVLGE